MNSNEYVLPVKFKNFKKFSFSKHKILNELKTNFKINKI